MLSVTINKIRPGAEPRLREWLSEMSSRRSEVIETFADQTVRHVQAFIVQGADGPLFMMVAEIEDPARAERRARSFPWRPETLHRISGPSFLRVGGPLPPRPPLRW